MASSISDLVFFSSFIPVEFLFLILYYILLFYSTGCLVVSLNMLTMLFWPLHWGCNLTYSHLIALLVGLLILEKLCCFGLCVCFLCYSVKIHMWTSFYVRFTYFSSSSLQSEYLKCYVGYGYGRVEWIIQKNNPLVQNLRCLVKALYYSTRAVLTGSNNSGLILLLCKYHSSQLIAAVPLTSAPVGGQTTKEEMERTQTAVGKGPGREN